MATYLKSIRHISTWVRNDLRAAVPDETKASGAEDRRGLPRLGAWIQRHRVQITFLVRYALVCAVLSILLPRFW